MNRFEKIVFSKNNTNIVIVNLKNIKSYSSKLIMYLSPKERFQANKLIFKHLRNNYIVSHGILRILLGKYLCCSPSQVEYLYNDYQKPLCKNDQSIYFNISHSHEYACYAFCLNRPIGIDIEFIDNKISMSNLLPIIATQQEFFIFDKLEEYDKIYSFYKIWTTKEAFLKALGFGLSFPLSNIETTILPKAKFEVIRCHNMSKKEIYEEWTFSSINFLSGYLGTIAVKKKNAHINIISL